MNVQVNIVLNRTIVIDKSLPFQQSVVFIFRVTLKMNTAQVVETSVTVNNQDHVHSGNHTQPTYGMTPGFKPLTK